MTDSREITVLDRVKIDQIRKILLEDELDCIQVQISCERLEDKIALAFWAFMNDDEHRIADERLLMAMYQKVAEVFPEQAEIIRDECPGIAMPACSP